MSYISKISSPIHIGRFKIKGGGKFPDVAFTDQEQEAIDKYIKAGKIEKEKPVAAPKPKKEKKKEKQPEPALEPEPFNDNPFES